MRKILTTLLSALLIYSGLLGCTSRETRLRDAGNEIVHKVEAYKISKGRLPSSLSVIGIPEQEEGPIYYQRVDSINYVVWFGTAVGESVTYSSTTKKWMEQ